MLETTAIQNFLEAVKQAARSQSRDVRLALVDATVLTVEIGSILSRLTALENKTGENRSSSVIIDGGSLR